MLDPQYLSFLMTYNPTSGILRWTDKAPAPVKNRVVHALAYKGHLVFRLQGTEYSAAQAAWALSHSAWPTQAVWCRNGAYADIRLDNLTLRPSESKPHNTPEARTAQARALERIHSEVAA